MTASLNDVIARGPIADRPVHGVPGRLYFTSDTNTLYRDSGLGWVAISLGAALSSATPSANGTAAAGTSAYASRGDHVHAMPTYTDVGAAPLTHAHLGTGSFTYVMDGGGGVLSTGSRGYIELPVGIAISGVRLVADQTGSAVVDIRKAAYADLPTTTSICASALPTLTSARTYSDATLTGWTTALDPCWLEIKINSISLITRLSLSLTYYRTV